MDEKQRNKILTVVFIVINIILWPTIILYNTGALSFLFNKDNGSAPTASTAQVNPNYNSYNQKLTIVDFNSMRDPFIPGAKVNIKRVKQVEVSRPRSSTGMQTSSAQPQGGGAYTSQYRLISIVELKSGYTATLEDTSSISQTPNTPYSYRFGTAPENTESKSQEVQTGDMIGSEKVVKITDSYVILTKNGQYYKLTFSGGYPVRSAE